jgi:hypothetical protein
MSEYAMGYAGPVYYGAAGSTAAIKVVNRTDCTVNFSTEKGETTVAGDGTAVPIKTESPTCRIVSIDLTTLDRSDDATVSAMKAAAIGCTAVAIKTEFFDGDCNVDLKTTLPLKGEKTQGFTLSPRYVTRVPVLAY